MNKTMDIEELNSTFATKTAEDSSEFHYQIFVYFSSNVVARTGIMIQIMLIPGVMFNFFKGYDLLAVSQGVLLIVLATITLFHHKGEHKPWIFIWFGLPIVFLGTFFGFLATPVVTSFLTSPLLVGLYFVLSEKMSRLFSSLLWFESSLLAWQFLDFASAVWFIATLLLLNIFLTVVFYVFRQQNIELQKLATLVATIK